MIWSELGKIEDFRKLFIVNKQVKSEAISQIIPSATISSLQVRRVVQVTIVIDGHSSDNYWIGFQVLHVKGGSTFNFSISGFDSPSAKFLSFLAPSKSTMEFRVPKDSHDLASFVTMKSKLADVFVIRDLDLKFLPGPDGC
ncbi:hypothetical protein QBC38DRAFT_177082 [Podospora fimiseda]|uniref:Uncharacterized protein n=1 Tax=Podospora fimiseda TaxID=252190 RepID=A0AAN7BY92_9PEZI|nr:hypothetical protein QBC38DRAFT_177082 [Podospora fimiseda]